MPFRSKTRIFQGDDAGVPLIHDASSGFFRHLFVDLHLKTVLESPMLYLDPTAFYVCAEWPASSAEGWHRNCLVRVTAGSVTLYAWAVCWTLLKKDDRLGVSPGLAHALHLTKDTEVEWAIEEMTMQKLFRSFPLTGGRTVVDVIEAGSQALNEIPRKKLHMPGFKDSYELAAAYDQAKLRLAVEG